MQSARHTSRCTKPHLYQTVLCFRYGKAYDELDSSEKQSVGGTKGGRARAEGAGSEGMAEMGKQGGSVTKDDTGSSW